MRKQKIKVSYGYHDRNAGSSICPFDTGCTVYRQSWSHKYTGQFVHHRFRHLVSDLRYTRMLK